MKSLSHKYLCMNSLSHKMCIKARYVNSKTLYNYKTNIRNLLHLVKESCNNTHFNPYKRHFKIINKRTNQNINETLIFSLLIIK